MLSYENLGKESKRNNNNMCIEKYTIFVYCITRTKTTELTEDLISF